MSAKTKEKMLKILQGRNAQDGKEQKKQMVRLEWNLIDFFFIKTSLFWVSTIYVLKMNASTLNSHPS